MRSSARFPTSFSSFPLRSWALSSSCLRWISYSPRLLLTKFIWFRIFWSSWFTVSLTFLVISIGSSWMTLCSTSILSLSSSSFKRCSSNLFFSLSIFFFRLRPISCSQYSSCYCFIFSAYSLTYRYSYSAFSRISSNSSKSFFFFCSSRSISINLFYFSMSNYWS